MEPGARDSRRYFRRSSDHLRNSPCILLIDVERRYVDVDQSGLYVGMAHQFHQCGQADAGTHHVRGEGVSEPVRISESDAGGLAMLPDDGPRGKFFKDREEFPW